MALTCGMITMIDDAVGEIIQLRAEWQAAAWRKRTSGNREVIDGQLLRAEPMPALVINDSLVNQFNVTVRVPLSLHLNLLE